MTKEDIKKGIIGLLVLALIIGGIYYYKSYTKSRLSSEAITLEESPSGEILPKDGTSTENSNTENVTKAEVAGVDKTQFNTLLAAGSKAYMDKNYSLAIKTYNEALALDPSDVVYIRLFSVYNSQGNVQKAEEMLNKAIAKNPSYTDYWTTKLSFLDEIMKVSFANLKAVYEDGFKKVDPKSKINLVTHFARLAGDNNEKDEAIILWQKAIEINPSAKDVYQAEIDALK